MSPVTQLLSSYLHVLTLMLFSSFSPLSSSSSSCELQAQFQLSRTSQAGDVMLGGLFYINRFPVFYEGSFTSQPQDPVCYSFNDDGFRWAQTMAFAIDEINREPSLLPNVTVGYTIYDTCYSLGVGYRAALSLASGREERFQLVESCKGSPPLLAIMGPDSSTNSIAISKLLGLYRVPVGLALAQLMKRFQWSWVGVLFQDNDYGRDAARLFQLAMDQSGAGCVAYMQVMPWDQDRSELQRIVNMMKTSTARVVIAFIYGTLAANLLDEVIRQNVSGLQWISEVSWQTDMNLQRRHFLPVLRGTVGLATRQGQIPGFQDFLLKIHPSNDPDISHGRSIVKQFWEHTFQCKFAPLPPEWADAGGRVCTGQEDLRATNSPMLHVSELREEYNVYKGAYALAHALHDMLQCVPGRGPFPGHSCATLQTIQPWQLLYYLENVNFTTSFGDHVFFDENGDSTPIFDLMNWEWLPDGSINVHKVGVVKESASGNIELFLDQDIFWSFDSTEPPQSVCSESCSPGTRVARRIGQPVCCFDCIACPEGQISNETDSTECTVCPEDFWSSPQHDHCIPKSIEFLSYHEALGISLTTISLLGTFVCAIVLGIFVYHKDTPMVRANNSELSFQLLLSLKLCFLCSLLFIGHPRLWTCQMRHAAFGISFVLCVSCILVKTMVVLAVFKASKPGGADIMKWFGAMQQRGTVLILTAIQGIICIVWLVSASPTPHKNTQYLSDKIVYECDVGSTVGFAVLLGYIGLLALLSFLLAFMVRNLPDNFNEAKLITFSMLIFCAVWIAFIPAYISSPGKYADVVEVFAILASSFGILLALFGPKCYIILLKPERNTKKSIMGRGAAKM